MLNLKRKAPELLAADADPKDILTITPLGAGQEVGRSCILLQYKGKTVMLDCGVHPAYSGLAALPFFDEVDPSAIDVLLISHFHLDHAAALPYFMEKTNFRGRVFMTHPTKAIYKWLLSDYVKVSNISVDDMLYDEQDLMRSYEKIETIDYHQEVDVDGIKFTAYNAGHVLGAAMFLLEIAGVKIHYTGDYSREEDRHLMAAERPPGITPDVMICESTYGVQSNEPRNVREGRFTGLIHETVQRGGRVLIPAFALGRAQELLLILDEYWQSRPELHSVPIYYASAMAKKCMAVYQTYVNMMNMRIRKQFATSNPFIFKHISNLKSIDHFEDSGPCVMMASPGMMQSGLSRDLLEKWCTDKRNTVIVPGYVVEGTLAKYILTEPEEIVAQDGRKLPLRMKVEYISFSAHVDYTQNCEFIDEMRPPHLVLVHGQANEMMRLKTALQDKYSEKQETMKLYTPANCQAVELYFRGEKLAKTIGSLAEFKPEQLDLISGVLVGKGFQYHLMDSKDIAEFTELKTTTILQKQCITYHGPFELVKFHIEQVFGPVQEASTEKLSAFKVLDAITVTHQPKSLVLEWVGNLDNDLLADSVVAVALQIESHPVSVKATKCSHDHGHHDSHSIGEEERANLIKDLFGAYFSGETKNIQYSKKTAELKLLTDGNTATVNLKTMKIKSDSEQLSGKLETILQEVVLLTSPLGAPWERT